ncbi:MAG: Threonine dehydratase, catabolic @ L-serine dehydratase, (PLP)-dependent [uncultured Frankineae bacterium]|uniref:L-threonine dehydratase catabolic TdcB n=1 Tax=uncultured Frankineae bacterium TaxID=437475 RepID=A0A6J4LRM2_9ACTN|nr:MAG: Threonine dehydratase, catabolic @ L-serine dehydratase, (PLP)-dependent [uncultured Frankineae bacterium]
MTETVVPSVGLEDVRAARELLVGIARTTPLEGLRSLSEKVGGDVLLKCENLQRTGSFKIRGAYVRIARLSEAERARGVVAASAGNHAQGVALAASLLGCSSTVFMPESAPLPKVAATRGYGAQVRHAGATVDEALLVARAHAEQTGAVLIHPFDHPDVIAGQGTVGLEILEQCPQVRTVVVCTGGGGLVSGIAAAVKGLRPDVSVVAAQATGAAAFPASLVAGRPVPLAAMTTMADGIAIGRPGDVTFPLVRDLVDRVVTVDEEALSRALLLCLERAKLVVEPAGAAAVASVMEDPTAFAAPVVAVVSGGNIDPLLLTKVVRHGLVAAGRFLSLRVAIPDRPGALAQLLAVLATTGGNVLDVEHSRTGRDLHVDEVEVALQLETRGRPHGAEVLAALAAAGYRVTPD